MVCFRYIIVNTLHKSDNKDNNNNNNNNNNNTNNNSINKNTNKKKSDIIICDNKKGTCMLIEIAIPEDINVIKKEI
jgi:hypothetical protein